MDVLIDKALQDQERLIASLRRPTYKQMIEDVAGMMIDTLNRGNTIFWCGNGGSAADCQHLSAELCFQFKIHDGRPGLRSIPLTVDTSLMSAIGNDRSFDEVFSIQARSLMTNGDMLIVVSTSGTSRNILRVMDTACQVTKGPIVAFTGSNGIASSHKHMCDVNYSIRSDDTPRIQEAFLLIGHILCEIVEKELKKLDEKKLKGHTIL